MCNLHSHSRKLYAILINNTTSLLRYIAVLYLDLQFEWNRRGSNRSTVETQAQVQLGNVSWNGLELSCVHARSDICSTKRGYILPSCRWRGIHRGSSFLCSQLEPRSLNLALFCTSRLDFSLAVRVFVCGEPLEWGEHYSSLS